MALPILSCRNVMLSFGGKPLLDDIEFHIEPRQRYCLIGKNGCGKSTLLKLINGELDPDKGEIYTKPGISIHFLPQDPPFKRDVTVFEYIDYPVKHEVDIFLEIFGLDPKASVLSLSGGEKRRAALIKTLCGNPDLLLLDEPTNHMDIFMIEWLEEYLNRFQGGVICISHDRSFLSNITNKTLWLDRGILRTHDQGYKDYERWQEQVLEHEGKRLSKINEKLKQELVWLHQGVTARRRRNQRRLKELHELRNLKRDKMAELKKKQGLGGQVQSAQSPQVILKAKNVSFTFEGRDKPIIQDFSIQIERKDRLGIIGPNGSGKTTLLKLFVGSLKPQEGSLHVGDTVEFIYLDQMRSTLNLDQTPWQNLTDSDYVTVDGKVRHVVGYLKEFMFDEKEIRGATAILSGGQRNRLALSKALCQTGNVLVLDEPTNDLDMDTLDLLMELLSDYDGTLILVSHDRAFLDDLTTSVLVLDGSGSVKEYIGGYSDIIPPKRRVEAASKKSAPAPSKPSQEKRGVSYKDKYAYETLSKEIAALEQSIKDVETTLDDSTLYTRDPAKFEALSAQLVDMKKTLEDKEHAWFLLAEKLH